jgi:hypothetical protein
MKYWVATYPSAWLGGIAIVEAEDEWKAREELHRYLKSTADWRREGDLAGLEIRELKSPVDEVWDGDY